MTSSSSYRPAIVSPTTLESYPPVARRSRGSAGARLPQAQAEPQASTPQDVQNGGEARQEPDWNELVPLSVLGSAGDEDDHRTAGEAGTEADHEPWSCDSGRAEAERQRERDHGNEIPGHYTGI